MSTKKPSRSELLLQELREREKELRCLYEIDEILNNQDISIPALLKQIVRVIPRGWQFIDICQAKITYAGKVYCSEKCIESPWVLSAEINFNNENRGSVDVLYTQKRPKSDHGPFLDQELNLSLELY